MVVADTCGGKCYLDFTLVVVQDDVLHHNLIAKVMGYCLH
jgi:hypothetical protein